MRSSTPWLARSRGRRLDEAREHLAPENFRLLGYLVVPGLQHARFRSSLGLARTDRAERKYRNRASAIATKLATMRVRIGIMGAYGEKAEQLGLGKRTPPSRRDRGAPAA